jgi:sn-glycerol 3-phosphate transport system permease protein
MKRAKARPYLMIAPSMVLLGAFSLYPVGYMVYLSFFKWNMMGPKVFIGLKNYADMLASDDFRQILGNTLSYMAMSVVAAVSISFFLALFLRANTRVNRFLQASIFAPYVISLVSVAFIWSWFMDSDYGLLNYLLQAIGLPALGWLRDPRVALKSLVIVSVWKGLGFDTMLFLSALQTIPAYLYEAARLDKARPVPVFRRITLPMLSPTLFFVLLTNIIASFKTFETIGIMTQGGPLNSTNTLAFSIYQYGFKFFKIGYASAIGVALMLLVGIFTLVYFQMLGRRIHYR